MKISEILTESITRPVIIVDIQPGYNNWCRDVGIDLMDELNKSNRKILVFFNGRDLDLDSEHEVIQYFIEDLGMDEDVLHRMNFIEKTYGFFRGWMDSDIPDKLIIKVIREMLIRREYDSRDIEEELPEIIGELEWEKYEDIMTTDPLIFPFEEKTISFIRSYNGALLTGGGRHECLKEIELLMNAINMTYRKSDNFIY